MCLAPLYLSKDFAKFTRIFTTVHWAFMVLELGLGQALQAGENVGHTDVGEHQVVLFLAAVRRL